MRAQRAGRPPRRSTRCARWRRTNFGDAAAAAAATRRVARRPPRRAGTGAVGGLGEAGRGGGTEGAAASGRARPRHRLRGVPASAASPSARAPAACRRPEVDDEPAGRPRRSGRGWRPPAPAARADLEAAQAAVRRARRRRRGRHLRRPPGCMLDDPALARSGAAAHRATTGRAPGAPGSAATGAAAAATAGSTTPYLRERAVDVEDVAGRVLARLAGRARAAAPAGAGHPRRRRAHARRRRRRSTPRWCAASPPRAAAPRRTPRSSPARSASPPWSASAPALLAVAEGTARARRRRGHASTSTPDAAALAEREARRRGGRARPPRRARARAARAGARRATARRIEVVANIGCAGRGRGRRSRRAPRASACCARSSSSSTAPTPPDEDEQVAVLREIAARARRPPARRPHARRRRRQAAAVPAPGAGGQPVPRRARHPPLARRSPTLFAHAAAGDPARGRRAPRSRSCSRWSPRSTSCAPRARALDAARAALGQRPAARGRRDGRGARASRSRPRGSRRTSTSSRSAPTTSPSTRWPPSAGTPRSPPLLDGPLPPVLRADRRRVRRRRGPRPLGRACAASWPAIPDAAVLLAGLGVRELSMAAGRIPAVKDALRATDLAAARGRRAAPGVPRAVACRPPRGEPDRDLRPTAVRPSHRRRHRPADPPHAGGHGARAGRGRRTAATARRWRRCCSAVAAATDWADGRLARALGRDDQARLVPRHDGGQAAGLRRADRPAGGRARLALDRGASSSGASS